MNNIIKSLNKNDTIHSSSLNDSKSKKTNFKPPWMNKKDKPSIVSNEAEDASSTFIVHVSRADYKAHISFSNTFALDWTSSLRLSIRLKSGVALFSANNPETLLSSEHRIYKRKIINENESNLESLNFSLRLQTKPTIGHWGVKGLFEKVPQIPAISIYIEYNPQKFYNKHIICIIESDGRITLQALDCFQRNPLFTEIKAYKSQSNDFDVNNESDDSYHFDFDRVNWLKDLFACCAAWNSTGQKLALGGRGLHGSVCIFNLSFYKESSENQITAKSDLIYKFQPAGNEDYTTSMAFFIDINGSEKLITGHSNGSIKLWTFPLNHNCDSSVNQTTKPTCTKILDTFGSSSVTKIICQGSSLIVCLSLTLFWWPNLNDHPDKIISRTLDRLIVGLVEILPNKICILLHDGLFEMLELNHQELSIQTISSMLIGHRIKVGDTTDSDYRNLPCIGLDISPNKSTLAVAFFDIIGVPVHNMRMKTPYAKVSLYTIDIPLKQMLNNATNNGEPYYPFDIVWTILHSQKHALEFCEIFKNQFGTVHDKSSKLISGIAFILFRYAIHSKKSIQDILFNNINFEKVIFFRQKVQVSWIEYILKKFHEDQENKVNKEIENNKDNLFNSFILTTADLACLISRNLPEMISSENISLLSYVYSKIGTSQDLEMIENIDKLDPCTTMKIRGSTYSPLSFDSVTISLTIPDSIFRRNSLTLETISSRSSLSCPACQMSVEHESAILFDSIINEKQIEACLFCGIHMSQGDFTLGILKT